MNDFWENLVWFLFHRHTRYAAAWLVALGLAGHIMQQAWIVFNDDRRADGNNGHTHIDFGGQYLMGRLLATGNGERLYHRTTQRQLLNEAYPLSDEPPPDQREPSEIHHHDAAALMGWVMGTDDCHAVGGTLVILASPDPLAAAAITAAGTHHWDPARLRQAVANRGGPLYPPVNAFYYAPLGLFRPQTAYRVFQVFLLILAFVTGQALSFLTGRRLWWPVATAFVLIFPGFGPNIMLGQNAGLTLAIVTVGWALVGRGHPIAGGVVWGLLAFKPVWALAFFLVPLLTGRWRVCLAMAITGTAIAAATLPWVGLHSWLDWLQIGREAAQQYGVNLNWVYLSRDLLNVPRRWLIDFKIYPQEARDTLAATLLGWALLGVVFELTVRLTQLRPVQFRQPTGPAAAFLFLGAWMCCYHFMYYDVLLTALPVALLFDPPRRFLEPRLVLLFPNRWRWPWWQRLRGWEVGKLGEYLRPGLPTELPRPWPGRGWPWVLNDFPLYLLGGLWIVEHKFPGWGLGPDINNEAWDTYLLLIVWLWCGWTVVRSGRDREGVDALPSGRG